MSVTLTDIMHPTRLKILNLLLDGPKELAIIAKDLTISKPEISRHLARLRDQGLVEKADKYHDITNLGQVILSIISPLEFIIKHYDYFMTHQFLDLPLSFVRDLDSLMKSELISGTGYIFSKIEKLRKGTTREVKIVVDQPFPGSSNGTNQVDEVLLIVPAHAKPENIDVEVIRRTSKYFEVRTVPVINCSFSIVDGKNGFIFFPGLDGKIDYNHTFYVTDSLGIDFLSRLWDYFWKEAQYRIGSNPSL